MIMPMKLLLSLSTHKHLTSYLAGATKSSTFSIGEKLNSKKQKLQSKKPPPFDLYPFTLLAITSSLDANNQQFDFTIFIQLNVTFLLALETNILVVSTW